MFPFELLKGKTSVAKLSLTYAVIWNSKWNLKKHVIFSFFLSHSFSLLPTEKVFSFNLNSNFKYKLSWVLVELVLSFIYSRNMRHARSLLKIRDFTNTMRDIFMIFSFCSILALIAIPRPMASVLQTGGHGRANRRVQFFYIGKKVKLNSSLSN